MKKIYLSLLCLGALAATSCSDYLDVRPKGEQVEGEQFETAKGFEDAIYGVYGFMTEEATYGKDLVWGIPEILCQNLISKQTDNEEFAKYNYKTNSSVRSRLLNMWTKAYTNIGYANNVLKNLDRKAPGELEYHNLYKGEMLGVRAMIHFDLLRMFASTDKAKRGIPYVKTFDFSVKPFSTVGQCIDYIIADLVEAEKLLAEEETLAYPRDNQQYERFNRWRESHMNLYAVKALLARVYWYTGDNANAARYAEEVITSGKFPLVDVTEVQNRISGVLSPKETIFGIYSTKYLETSSSWLYTWLSFHTYQPYSDSENSSYLLSWQNLYKLDVAGTAQDYRLTHFRVGSETKCLKMVDYLAIENNNTSTRPELISGISLINISELYLIAADALLTTNYTSAVKYFNDETMSRGLSPIADNKTLTSEMIYNEYHKEMFCEGQHWFNMKRLNRNIESNLQGRTIPASDDVYVLPIPEEEFEYRPEDNK